MSEAIAIFAPPVDRLAAFAALKSDFSARAAAGAATALAGLLASGLGDLDAALRGGFVRGTIATLEGAAGSGRMAIAARLLALATRTGLAAVIDDGSLFPPGLARAGVVLDRLLVIPARGTLGIARTVDIVLRSRVFGIVLMPAIALRAAVWSRLAGLAQKAGTLLLALGERAGDELAALAATRIECVFESALLRGARGVFTQVAGYALRACVLKHRRGAPGTNASIRALERDDGTPLRERTVERSRLRAVMV
jgi:hypothetical protein